MIDSGDVNIQHTILHAAYRNTGIVKLQVRTALLIILLACISGMCACSETGDNNKDRLSGFGVSVSYVMPVRHDIQGGFGAGFEFNYMIRRETFLELSAESYKVKEDDIDVTSSLFHIKAIYLKCFSDILIGGGGGIGMTVQTDDDSWRYGFAELKTGYMFNTRNRLCLSFMLSISGERENGTLALGYEFLF